jgi:AcrR family transcriptional regulator
MAAEVARHLAAARGVPDVDGVVQVEVLGQEEDLGSVSGRELGHGLPLCSPTAAAARQLFAENGFFQTKVEQIAKLSRVSPATVYAQCGGKQGLLRLLMDSWTQSQVIAESYQESLAAADAVLVMQTLSAAYLQITKQWGDVIRVMIDVAPHDGESAAVLATAQKRHNRNLTEICRHLERIGGLQDDVSARMVTRTITYYYGIDGLLRTRDVFGWSLERSNQWLLAHASAAVLRSPSSL